MSNPNPALRPGDRGVPTTPGAIDRGYFDPRQDGWDFYWYVTNIGAALAAAAQTQSQIQIDAGTDFFWVASTYQADLAGAAVTDSGRIIPLVTVLINDTGSSKNLMNAALPLPEIAGTGQEPYRLIRPRLFRANSVINFTWANYSAATSYSNLYMTLHGYRRPSVPIGQ